MRKSRRLMERARRIDPVEPDAFRDLARTSEAQETLSAILQVDPADTPLNEKGIRSNSGSATEAFSKPVPRSVGRRSLGLATVVAMALGATYFGTLDERSPQESRFPGELIAMAEGSPRLLVGHEGWSVVSAGQVSGDIGEMTFANGDSCTDARAPEGCYWMTLNWQPAGEHARYVKDRRRGADIETEISINGKKATLLQHDGTAPMDTTFYALWVDAQHSLELRSDVFPHAAEFRKIAESVYDVDAETWLAAMPASVVKPNEREDAVDRILAGLPVPSTVDIAALKNARRVAPAHALQYEVTTAVVCGWVQQWADAKRAGDRVAMKEAGEALADSKRWTVMKDYGGASYVFDVAEAMAANKPLDGSESLPIATGYQRHLGCAER